MFQRVPTVICLLTSDLCLLPFTTVESPLQISPFLCKTNPILSAVGGLQMNVTSFITKYYENKWQRRVRKNKPNSNPIKANFRNAQMNVSSLITKDYRKNDDFAVRKNKPNSNPKRTQNKANFKLEANLSPRERRSLRVSFSESSNRGPIPPALYCLYIKNPLTL